MWGAPSDPALSSRRWPGLIAVPGLSARGSLPCPALLAESLTCMCSSLKSTSTSTHHGILVTAPIEAGRGMLYPRFRYERRGPGGLLKSKEGRMEPGRDHSSASSGFPQPLLLGPSSDAPCWGARSMGGHIPFHEQLEEDSDSEHTRGEQRAFETQ